MAAKHAATQLGAFARGWQVHQKLDRSIIRKIVPVPGGVGSDDSTEFVFSSSRPPHPPHPAARLPTAAMTWVATASRSRIERDQARVYSWLEPCERAVALLPKFHERGAAGHPISE